MREFDSTTLWNEQLLAKERYAVSKLNFALINSNDK